MFPVFRSPTLTPAEHHAGDCLPDARRTILREGNKVKDPSVYAIDLAADSFGVEDAARWPPVAFSLTRLPPALHQVPDKDTTRNVSGLTFCLFVLLSPLMSPQAASVAL